jgi:tetratricopeptide (TPR) repeat protein
MPRIRGFAFSVIVLLCSISYGQISKITITAGTDEDKELTAIGNEQDAQKKISLYQDFLRKYANNPMAVAYGSWQLSQTYQAAGDMQKAIDAGDKALAASPRNLDILTSQVMIAQQFKDNTLIFKYALEGGDAYDSIDKQVKPANVPDELFQSNVESDKQTNKSAYQFFQSAAFNVIPAETDAKTRMDDIEKFTSTFPKSGMDDQLVSYALMSLAELKDNQRLIAYAEKILASDPENLSALLMLANTYVENPGSSAKAVAYAQKAIVAAKADAPDAGKSRKVSAGIAHCVIGRAYANEGKTLPSIGELKSATALLKGQDEQQYTVAAYFLGWDYAKLNKLSDARAILTEAAAIPGPMQAPTKDLLAKINSARAAGK